MYDLLYQESMWNAMALEEGKRSTSERAGASGWLHPQRRVCEMPGAGRLRPCLHSAGLAVSPPALPSSISPG